jgi:hypothetical protein
MKRIKKNLWPFKSLKIKKISNSRNLQKSVFSRAAQNLKYFEKNVYYCFNN